eukprot:12154539-Alexandrium_andersonii.AAC.1
MSASLVGSEMCIRDRPASKQNRSSRAPLKGGTIDRKALPPAIGGGGVLRPAQSVLFWVILFTALFAASTWH